MGGASTGGQTGAAGASAGSGGVGGGMGGAAGTGGSAGGGIGGAGGSGGGLSPGCESLGTPGKTGVQCDPGLEGNGTFDQVEPPGDQPPEAEGDPEGMLSGTESFSSTLYGYDFDYRIYVPTAYQAGKPAALMVFQDGPNYTDVIRTPRIMDTLIAAGEMPVAIAVFIQPGNNRSEEYDSRTDQYGSFLLTEFLPNVVLNAYDIVDDPNGWLIGGHSSGGCCAFNAAWFFPEKFHKVVTHMGSFVGIQDDAPMDAYIDIVTTEAPKPLRVSQLSGTNDLGGGAWFEANNNMSASLQTAGYANRYMKSTTTHNLTPWASNDFPDALRWMWRGYSLPHYEAVP